MKKEKEPKKGCSPVGIIVGIVFAFVYIMISNSNKRDYTPNLIENTKINIPDNHNDPKSPRYNKYLDEHLKPLKEEDIKKNEEDLFNMEW